MKSSLVVDFAEILKDYSPQIFWNYLYLKGDENLEIRNEDITAIKFPNEMWIDIGCYDYKNYTVCLIKKGEDWYDSPHKFQSNNVDEVVEAVKRFAIKTKEGIDNGSG